MEYIKEKVIGILKKNPVRYLISSLIAFVVNYIILLGLNAVFKNISGLSMEFAAVPAFLASSQINFWINRRWVFRSKKAPIPELFGYYSLAIFSFIIKTYVLLEIMVRLFKLPLAISSPMAEVIMFAINYAVQKVFIFKNKKR